MLALTPALKAKLARGEAIEVNGRIYAYCRDCSSVIRVDKPIIGSLHYCD